MQVDYNKLWIRLKDKNIKNKTALIPMSGISTNILAKLNKGEYIFMKKLYKICNIIDGDIGDYTIKTNKIILVTLFGTMVCYYMNIYL